jgi:tetratricopeptide (TPR) repeat protein/transcriptional regulator with XRE-family HTH domain
MDTMQPRAFGTLLRRLRTAAGLTQEELAERAHLSVRGISNLERGVRRLPQRGTVALLAEALRLSPEKHAALEEAARRLRTAASAAPARSDAATPPLVGRQRELALLERHLGGQRPPVLLLAGEPGIGKTRLLHAAVPRAVAQGLRVLEGGCQRRGGQEPYAPLLQAVQRHIRSQPPDDLRAQLQGCAWLVRMLPELIDGPIEALPPWTVPPEQERRLMFEAVARFLANVAGPGRGTLLLLDDLQWAGGDALDLLATLVRSLSSTHRERGLGAEGILWVVGAYRDTEVKPRDPLLVTLADLAQAGLATHHTLAPLGVEEAAQLLDGLLEGSPGGEEGEGVALRTRVLQRAGGVPFFVVSYAQGLRQRERDDQDVAVPWDVAQGVRQRVVALPESARAALGAAAVLGRLVPPAILVAAMTQPEEEVLAALEVACQARLLVDEGHTYRFAHDVIREVIETDVGTARRQLLHRRIAAAIETICARRLSEYYETLAFHYQQSETWEKAIEYLVKSGDKAAAASATQEALAFYDQAFALCGTLGSPAMSIAIDVAQKRGSVLADMGDFHGAAAEFARMQTAASAAGDRRREGMALAHRGTALYYAHDFAAAEETLQAALTVAANTFEGVRFIASAQLGSLLAIINRHAEAVPLLAAAEDLAPRVDDPFGQAWWSIIDAEWLHWAGHYDEALALLDRWRGAVQASHQVIVLLWHRWEEAIARGGKGDYTRALALLEEVLAICDRIGEAVVAARAANTAGWLYGELQDHQRALALNTQSLNLGSALKVPDPEISSNARLNLGDSLAALGRLDEAEEHFQTVEQLVRHPRPEDRWMLWRFAQHLFHSYGELWLVRGDGDRALSYADECLQLAETSDSRKNIVKARRLRGQVFLARGAVVEAEVELDRAIDTARQIGNPPQLWKTLATVGELRQAQGRLAASRQAYHEATSIIDSVAAGLHDKSLRDTFLSSLHVQHIRRS